MGTRTDQAREQVIAARQALGEELTELRRSALEAVNLPARARDDPLRLGTVAAGTAFFLLGGPQRLLRRLRRLLFGAPTPRSLLPEEIEKAVEGMGGDREAVKRHLEREFADYLEEHRADRRRTMMRSTALGIVERAVGAFSRRAARDLAMRLFEPRSANRSGAGRDAKTEGR